MTRATDNKARVIVQVGKFADREPPHSPEAEMALLGAIIISPAVMPAIMALVPSADMFWEEKHQAIYRALQVVYGTTRGGDLVMLSAELRAAEQFEAVGGGPYLVKLASETPGPAAASHYAKIVAANHRLRELIKACGEAIHHAYNTGSAAHETADEVVAKAAERIAGVRSHNSAFTDISVEEAEDQVLADIQNPSKPTMYLTGFEDIDRQFGGVPRSGVLGILAAPSVGKSTFMLQVLQNIGMGVGDQAPVESRLFSYEQQPLRVAATTWSQRAGVNMHGILNRNGAGLTAEEWKSATSARRQRPMIKICHRSMHGQQIYDRASIYKSQGVGIIAVDYLQLLNPIPGFERGEERLSENMRVLASIARDFEMLVIIVAQMDKQATRSIRGEEERAPVASDCKGTSAYEQNIDISWCLHRPHRDMAMPTATYHSEHEWAASGELVEWRKRVAFTVLNVDKNKNGPLGRVEMRFNAKAMAFESAHAPTFGHAEGVF